nr:unnamed protein product [Meloidogyne enterolobii]
MDDALTIDYLRKVIGQSLFSPRLLVWDSFRCHLSDSTKKELKQLNVHTALILGGTTKWFQPGDVCLNGPFKQHIQRLYDDWLMHGQKEFTFGGNPRPPPMRV